MSKEHQFIIDSTIWPHPLFHPRQVEALRHNFIGNDDGYTAPPGAGYVRTLQHNFEDRLRRAGAEFNPRTNETEPHTYRIRVPEERVGELILLLQQHPAARSIIHIPPTDGVPEKLTGTPRLESAPQVPAKRIIARFRLQDGAPVPCAEDTQAAPGDALALLMADHREHRYGGQEYLAELAGRPLAPGEDGILILHNGGMLRWISDLKRRFEDDVEAYITCRDSKTLFHVVWPSRLHRLPHGVIGWRCEPMDTLPDGLLETIRNRTELMERMRYHCERVAMSRQPMPGCACLEGGLIRPLSLCDLLQLWQSGKHPWVAQSYHDGPFLTYRTDPDGTAHAWSLQLQCPVSFTY